MNLRQTRITIAIALFLVFSTTQLYVSVSFAGPQPITDRSEAATPAPQQATGSLPTHRNKPINVNGASAISEATMVSGASLQTRDGVGATVNLRGLGSLQIEPNTKLTLEFQTGSVRVMLIQGCVTLRTKKGTAGEVDTAQSVLGKTDPAKDGVIKTCPDRAAPAEATAGATGGGGGGLFGIGMGASISLLALTTTIVLVPLLQRGGNPSPVGL